MVLKQIEDNYNNRAPARKKLSIPRAWGHEQFLNDLIDKRVTIVFTDGKKGFYDLKAFDRYTVLVEAQNAGIALFFKSSMISIEKTIT